MWQIEWMIGLLPTWMFHIIVATGIGLILASWILKRIPFISQYNFPIHLIGIALTVIGVYYEGGRGTQAAWEARVKEMEAKVAKAEVESKAANEKINDKVEKAKEKIVQKQVVVKQYIDREIVKYDNTCVIPKEFIEVHNKAATK